MSRLILSRHVQDKLQAIADYYSNIDDDLAIRAIDKILQGLRLLMVSPKIGRPYAENIQFRERVIRFGNSHFVALYVLDKNNNITVLSIKHERERSHEADEES